MQTYHIQFPGLGVNFNISPVAIKLGSFEIMWYGIIIAVGFLLSFLYALSSCRAFKVNQDKFINVALVGLITGIIGARAYYVIFYPGDMFLKDPSSIFAIHEGGLAIYGGIIGGLLGGLIVAKLQKLKLSAVMDIAALGLLIGQAIGRWGNFVNQEAFGIPTELPWRMLSENTYGVGVHPCFLYESIWCALGFVLLHIFSRRFRKYDGQVFLLYMVWYGLERFVVEGLRTDSLYIVPLGLRVSQVLALACIVLGIALLIALRNKKTARRTQRKT